MGGTEAAKYRSAVTCGAGTSERTLKAPVVGDRRGPITSDWLVGTGRGNSGQVLFAQLLVELVYHLFEGEIEMDTLNPKIFSLIKKTVV